MHSCVYMLVCLIWAKTGFVILPFWFNLSSLLCLFHSLHSAPAKLFVGDRCCHWRTVWSSVHHMVHSVLLLQMHATSSSEAVRQTASGSQHPQSCSRRRRLPTTGALSVTFTVYASLACLLFWWISVIRASCVAFLIAFMVTNCVPYLLMLWLVLTAQNVDSWQLVKNAYYLQTARVTNQCVVVLVWLLVIHNHNELTVVS